MFIRLSEHLIICIRQVFPDDNTFASAGDDVVSLLTIEEVHKNGPCSGAAALSCPVGHLDVVGSDRDATLVTEDRTHFAVQSAAVSFSGTLHTRRFHLLEYVCRSFTSFSHSA